MGQQQDHAVVAFVTGTASEHLERERRRWDPVMVERVAGHVTIAYPDEIGHLDLLVARLRAACARTPPFPLVLGPVATHGHNPARGVHHLVVDPVGAWKWLREFLLAPPFVLLDVVPHATIAHPRTAAAPAEAWRELEGHDPDIEFRVGGLHLLASERDRWVVVEELALEGGVGPPP